MKNNYKKMAISTTQVIILSFLAVILIGGMILSLPVSSQSGHMTPFIDAVFTATTSVCVTGLVTVNTAAHWSLFGKVVILILIQIGGLGVVTIAMMMYMLVGAKISLGARMLLGDSFNLDTLSGLVVFLKKVITGTFIVEAGGAICYMPVFIKEYGIAKGLWFSVFHSISAFCNAGIDILGDNSFAPYVTNPWMNLVTMCLIILGGIGFIVWWDVISLFQKKVRHLSLHSKIVITMTLFLIAVGAVLYFMLEYHNPATIGEFSFPEKVMACLFQSVTTRTAGFAMISQKGLCVSSVIVSMILMFIGGSSVGTAGGVKTGTVAVVFLAVKATVHGEKDVTAFKKRIPVYTVTKSVAVITISVAVSLVALFLMCTFVPGETSDIAYEVYSAVGTAGLSRDFTAGMNLIGKVIICICMYLGRIGPMSLVVALTAKSKNESVRYMEEEITVG